MTAILKGFEGLERKLVGLEKKVGKKIVRSAARKASKPALDTAKQNALTMVGGKMGTLISKNLHIRGFRKQKRGQFGLSMKIKPGVPEFIHTGKDGTRYYIPAAIEYGHANAMGIPFMRAASDMTRNKRVKILGRELAAGIMAVAKRG
jgi:HK97 gp10 family phage protein